MTCAYQLILGAHGEPQVANESSGILIHLQDPNIPSGDDSRPIVTQPLSNGKP